MSLGKSEIIDLDTVRADVNSFIKAYFVKKQSKASGMHKDYGFLWQSLVDLHDVSGKRMRPYLLLLIYEAFGGKNYQDILPVAVSVELLHSAMLIHDDVIDRDNIRHGSPNISGMYLERYVHEIENTQDNQHFANSAAILAGDLMLSEAYLLILGSKITANQKTHATDLIGEAVFTVVGGELLDTEAVFSPPEDIKSLLIAEFKSAFYSFTLPLKIGGMLANVPKSASIILGEFGRDLGIAFQLSDDLLGIFGETDKTGKTVMGDLREGKRTYLLQRTLELANDKQKIQLRSIVGNPKCDLEMAHVAKDIMINCGAKQDVETKMRQYADHAIKSVAKLPIDKNYQKVLDKFVEKSVWRNK